MKKHLFTLAFLCFLICLILALSMCKPTSAVPAKLVLHAPLYGTARANGTPYILGDVTNVGSAVAYDGRLFVIVNEGENEYECFLGDFAPGECKHFECDLVDYCWDDEIRCTFRLSWDQERLLACVSMDSARPSGGD